MDLIFPILNVILSTILIYGPQRYVLTNNINYLYLTILTTNILIYIIYIMFKEKYTILTTTLCGKIIPMVVLSLLGFFVVKDEKFTYLKLFAIVLVIIGTYILI